MITGKKMEKYWEPGFIFRFTIAFSLSVFFSPWYPTFLTLILSVTLTEVISVAFYEWNGTNWRIVGIIGSILGGVGGWIAGRWVTCSLDLGWRDLYHVQDRIEKEW